MEHPTTPDPTTDMTARRRYVVTCLAGHGIGPEVTAAASRALARLGREHGFDVEELHPPFDTEALTRSGHLLPAATRRATSREVSDAPGGAGTGALTISGVSLGTTEVTSSPEPTTPPMVCWLRPST